MTDHHEKRSVWKAVERIEGRGERIEERVERIEGRLDQIEHAAKRGTVSATVSALAPWIIWAIVSLLGQGAVHPPPPIPAAHATPAHS